MSDDDRLLDTAAALADGADIDWDSTLKAIADEDRELLAELRFIAEMTRTFALDPSGIPTRDSLARESEMASDTRLSPGDIWGPLSVIEHVGRGTFGDVYRAWDRRLDREVALKILRRLERGDQTDASSVIQEGRLLARVRHPNVVTVYGAERIDGRVGVWMEFVHGRTLEEELRDLGLFDVDRVIRIGKELSGALSTVHLAGLIHRDVKAQNVLCDRNGRLVLTDFGAGCERQESTATGAASNLAGTPLTVAPESLQGHPATPQADVYSLGVLLYHLVTGTYPVLGRSLEDVREAHRHGQRTPLATARPDLPGGFVRIVDRAIDPDPANRYDSPEALGSELTSLIDADEHDPASRSRGSRWRMNARRRLLVPAAIALVGGLSVWLAFRSDMIGRTREASSSSGALNPEVALVEIVTLLDHGQLEEAYERALRGRSAAPTSPLAANGVAYALTYAGFLDEAARAVSDVFAAKPDYLDQNGWWTPTALLYQRRLDQFLIRLQNVDSTSARVYRALAEVERGRRSEAVAHLDGIEPAATNVFSQLASGLHAALTGRPDDAAAAVRSLSDQRRRAADGDGELTFKQAQILGLAGHVERALTTLDEAVSQGFVCVECFESSSLLEPVRSLPGYRPVKARALARHMAFGRRFGLPSTPRPEARMP